MNLINKNGLKVNSILFEFINNEVIPGTNIDPEDFWKRFDQVVHELAPINKALIEKREIIQKKIDAWHKDNAGKNFDQKEYIIFLKSLSYLIEEKEEFKINTTNIDEEISSIAGPQLVVPVDNARYALNAANARWGSLYDALYGTDIIPGGKDKNYNEERGNKVIAYVRKLFDEIIPLDSGNWNDVSKIEIINNELTLFLGERKNYLKNKNQFLGFNKDEGKLSSVLIKNNNLHLDILIDPNSMIGKKDKANISDVIIESAISTIIDNEDSVAAVDAEDKVKCYRNWLGLMKGDLQINMKKNGKQLIRKLNPDRNYISTDG